MIKLTAPEGYKYKDRLTDTLHSEVITENRERFELVPDTTEPMIEE